MIFFPFLHEEAGGQSHRTCISNSLGSRTYSFLLSAAKVDRTEAGSFFDIKCAASFLCIDLVSADGKEINVHCFSQFDRLLTVSLNRITMDEQLWIFPAQLAADCTNWQN